jgi:hypothetical protein
MWCEAATRCAVARIWSNWTAIRLLSVRFAAKSTRFLEQIKSGLWPTHLLRQITGALTAYSYDGTKSSAKSMIHGFLGEFNGVGHSGEQFDRICQKPCFPSANRQP